MKNLKIIAIIAAMSIGITASYAASDGALQLGGSGTSSTGEFTFTLNKADAVKISDMTDITINASGNATGDQSGADNVCYYATLDYTVDIETANNFKVKTGAGVGIPYSVTWSEQGSDNSFTTNTDNPRGRATNNTLQENCGGGTNAQIQVDILAADFDPASVGIYSDTVSVVIALQ